MPINGNVARFLEPVAGAETVLRHVAASLWIAQGAKAKQVQTWMGHGSIKITYDLYGHLWSDPDDDRAMATGAEHQLLG